jgi:hypothetical protein
MRIRQRGPRSKGRAATFAATAAWGLALAISLLSHRASAQSASAGTTVDNFDDGNVSDWRPFAGGGGTISAQASSVRATSGLMSMKLSYTLPSGGYAGVEKLMPTPANWSGASALTMSVYGAGTGHRFHIQVYDAGNERWEYVFTVGFTGWQQVTIPFSSFAHAGFQVAGAQVNNVFDRGAIRGMALIPSDSVGSGTVYLDSLTVTAAAAPSAPAASPPVASTTTTPAPAAAATPSGTIIPLYSWPSSAWDGVVAAKKAYPKVPVLAVINPGNGPGWAANSSYLAGIAKMTSAGIKMIGYVPTTYGNRPAADVQADIKRWRSLYPGVTGIFLDEMNNRPGGEAYYRSITAFAKSQGLELTIGNPGCDVPPSYVGAVDVILVYESAGLPGSAVIGGWHASYDKRNFGVIPYNVWMDPTFVANARKTIGYIFLQNDTMPNPWDTVPPYFMDLLKALAL